LKVTCAAALDARPSERVCSCESAAANNGSNAAAQLASETRARRPDWMRVFKLAREEADRYCG
jgi:hypothetical protein